jgi:dephospho-CoA kinase
MAAPPPTKLRIGLTGGIGSGKSTVSQILADLGSAIVDTDRIARQLSGSGGAAIDAIAEAFGADLIDASGALDRARMRTLAFADSQARRRLEAILHPLIGDETERQARAASAPLVVFDVPLLVESGRWAAIVDRVWVIDCRESTQLERVVARSDWSEAAVRAVIEQQSHRSQRRRHADAVIYNDGIDLDVLKAEVRTLWEEAIALAR